MFLESRVRWFSRVFLGFGVEYAFGRIGLREIGCDILQQQFFVFYFLRLVKKFSYFDGCVCACVCVYGFDGQGGGFGEEMEEKRDGNNVFKILRKEWVSVSGVDKMRQGLE